MPNVVTRELVFENAPHSFSVDASELGLPPGEWPERLKTTLGDGIDFVLLHAMTDGSRAYRQDRDGMGIYLRVWND